MISIWNLARAIVTAPDVAHWIKKYDAAKARVDELEGVLATANEVHKSLEEVLGMQCLPIQMARFLGDKIASLEEVRNGLVRENEALRLELKWKKKNVIICTDCGKTLLGKGLAGAHTCLGKKMLTDADKAAGLDGK